MKLSFNEVGDRRILGRFRIAIVTGQYDLFINQVVDNIKDLCRGEISVNLNEYRELSADFGIDTSEDEEDEQGNLYSMNFNDFIEVVNNPPVSGLWYCGVYYSQLRGDQKKAFQEYMKRPSRFGYLVVICKEYGEYKDFLYNRLITKSDQIALFSLSFPNRQFLKDTINKLCLDRNIKLEPRAVEAFINRMSTKYDEYPLMLDKVVNNMPSSYDIVNVTLADLNRILKGIEYFNMDDFVSALTVPLSSGKTNNKKIIRMLYSMIDVYGAKGVVVRLKSKINECIDFRLMINDGTVPVGVTFFYSDIVKRLGDNKYAKLEEWRFKQKAELAASTSLRDWEYMKFILNKTNERSTDTDCQKALYELATRSVLSPSRINNIIGLENILEDGVSRLDSVKYRDKEKGHENLFNGNINS